MSSEQIIFLCGLISPTFFIAKFLKSLVGKNKIIRRSNWFYFLFSLACVVWASVTTSPSSVLSNDGLWILLPIILLSRCSEIMYAFLIDAYDKILEEKIETGGSSLPAKPWWYLELGSEPVQIHHRMVFALRSYVELICNFAVLYSLVPCAQWKELESPLTIVDTLYFSGVTITTLGYGDITPIDWLPKFLSVYQVFCGFTLLVVCFAVYLSRKSN